MISMILIFCMLCSACGGTSEEVAPIHTDNTETNKLAPYLSITRSFYSEESESGMSSKCFIYDIEEKKLEQKGTVSYTSSHPLTLYSTRNDKIYYSAFSGKGKGNQIYLDNNGTGEKKTNQFCDFNYLIQCGEQYFMAAELLHHYCIEPPILKNGLRLNLTGEIISRPYINLTLQLMKEFGADAAWSSESSITVRPEKYRDIPFTVESDWSGASYWYQMVALIQDNEKKESTKTEIKLPGLLPHSYQGDSRGAEIFAKLGVHTTYTDQGVVLTKMGTPVTCLKEDLVDIPDLAQTFVVTCCLMNIPFRFTGLQSLKIKETDRIQALITELNKLGYVVKSEQDSILIWNGERCEPASHPVIATYEDHRMAMAFAPAILRTPSIRIADPQVVSKSYPGYWEDLKQVGFRIEIEE